MKRLIREGNRSGDATSLLGDERGLTTVEYVILLVVIAIMSVAGWHTFGKGVKDKLDDSQKQFNDNVVH